MSDESSPAAHCPLYLPGHNVHWIQARLTWNEPQHDPIPATLLAVETDGEFTVEVDGEVRRYWNHEPQRLTRALRKYHGVFELVGYGVLTVPRELRRVGQPFPMFCIVGPDSEHRRPCPDPDDARTANPIERLRPSGAGFTIDLAATSVRCDPSATRRLSHP